MEGVPEGLTVVDAVVVLLGVCNGLTVVVSGPEGAYDLDCDGDAVADSVSEAVWLRMCVALDVCVPEGIPVPESLWDWERVEVLVAVALGVCVTEGVPVDDGLGVKMAAVRSARTRLLPLQRGPGSRHHRRPDRTETRRTPRW